jgi:hypothetical protein
MNIFFTCHFFGSIPILFFFFLIPFTYAFQVIFMRAEIAVIPYVFLAIGIISTYLSTSKSEIYYLYRNNLSFLFVGFVFLVFHHLFFGLQGLVSGDTTYSLRSLILFTLPLLIFFLVPIFSKNLLVILIGITTMVGGVLVGVEMLYETYSHHILKKPTLFQLINKNYVFSRIGQDLTQLYGINYRPPGLLEHVHVATYFIALSALGNLVFYWLKGRWYYMFGFMICSIALLVHGVRLPIIAFAIAFVAFAYLIWRSSRSDYSRKRGILIFLFLTLLIFCQLFWDPLGTAKIYYWPALISGDFQQGERGLATFVADNVEFRSVQYVEGIFEGIKNSENVMSPAPRNWLLELTFGYGVLGSLRGEWAFNDDLFIFSLVAQYGPPVAFLFFSLWLFAFYKGTILFLRSKDFDTSDKGILGFAICTVLVLFISLFHSSVLQRKVIYPFFPLALGIVWRYDGISRASRFGREDSRDVRG